jgi:hypothetical protein
MRPSPPLHMEPSPKGLHDASNCVLKFEDTLLFEAQVLPQKPIGSSLRSLNAPYACVSVRRLFETQWHATLHHSDVIECWPNLCPEMMVIMLYCMCTCIGSLLNG